MDCHFARGRRFIVRLEPRLARAGRHTLRQGALREGGGRFIIRFLRCGFALERLGELGLVEMVCQLAGADRIGGEAVNPLKRAFETFQFGLA